MRIWLVVKQWPNGRWEVAEAWKDEAKAQEAARAAVGPSYAVSLWVCDLKDAE